MSRSPETKSFNERITELLALPAKDRLALALGVKAEIDSFDKLITVLNKLEGTDAYAFARELERLISSKEELIEVYRHLQKLPNEFGLTFLAAHTDILLEGGGLFERDLLSILSLLGEREFKDRAAFLEDCVASIKTTQQLIVLLELLPMDERGGPALACKDVIGDFERLRVICNLLPPNDKSPLVRACESKIIDGSQLALALAIFNPDEKSIFAIEQEDKITNGDQLAHVLDRLPEDSRLSLATILKTKISNSNELAAVLGVLPADKKLNFAIESRSITKKVSDLVAVLRSFPDEDRAALAQAYPAVIQNGAGLCQILSIIEANRLSVAWACQDKIMSLNELIEVIQLLAEENWEAMVLACQDKIENGSQLVQVLGMLPEGSRGDLANNNKHKINGIDEMFHMLRVLGLGNGRNFRVFIVNFFKDKIVDGQQLLRVLFRLSQEFGGLTDGENLLNSIATACQDKIINASQLAGTLSFLPEGDARIVFATACQDKITSGLELTAVLIKLPEGEARKEFATACRDKIKNGAELSLVLGELSEGEVRKEFATACRDKIQNGYELAGVLGNLPRDELRDTLAEFCQASIGSGGQLVAVLKELFHEDVRKRLLQAQQGKIQNGYELAEVLGYVSDDGIRNDLVLSHQAKIQNEAQLTAVLNALPVRERLACAERNRSKITSLEGLEGFFSLPGLSELNSEEKQSFVRACLPVVRIPYLLDEKKYERALFEETSVQQMFILGSLDPNRFLFAAAADPLREDDFIFFLNHPLCSAYALNERVQSLVKIIENSSLTAELKRERIEKVEARLESERLHTAATYFGLNLSSVKPLPILTFSGELSAVGGAPWVISGVSAEEVQRFRQLTQWLKDSPALAPFKEYFVNFELNDAVKAKDAFVIILFALENFVAHVDTYLKERPLPTNSAEINAQKLALASHLDKTSLKQLSDCSAGVQSALDMMTASLAAARSLSSGAKMAGAVNTALDQARLNFIAMNGVTPNMEVHVNKDLALGSLGVPSGIDYDQYRLPISRENLRAIAANAAGRLTAERLVSETLPDIQLKSTPRLLIRTVFLDGDFIKALEADWKVLNAVGLLDHSENPHEMCVEVIRFISDLSLEDANTLLDDYLADPSQEPMRLSLSLSADKFNEKLKVAHQRRLYEAGILTLTPAEVVATENRIWQLLTTAELFSAEDDAFWHKFLCAPNGLAWIKGVIEKHPEEYALVGVKALTHIPEGSSQDLFRSFAANPVFAGWMMSWTIHWKIEQVGHEIQKTMSFNPIEVPSPLIGALSQLADNTDLMNREMEEISVLPGSLMFWLGQLQKDELRKDIFEAIVGFLNEHDMCAYDSILDVFAKMMKGAAEDDTRHALARSFLEERCEKQQELGLWGCYWKTACYLKGYEIKLDDKDKLLSLKNPDNMRAALYLAGSNQELILKIAKACANFSVPHEFVVITKTMSELSSPKPVSGVDESPAHCGAGVDERLGVVESKEDDVSGFRTLSGKS